MKISTRYLLHIILSLTIISCQKSPKIKSKEFAFEIKTWGIPSDYKEAFLYNTQLDTYNRERFSINKGLLDANTLYVLKHDFDDSNKKVDTLKIKLIDKEVDSLYNLTYKYLSSVDMNNEIEATQGIKAEPSDGFHFSISLLFNRKRLSCNEGIYGGNLSEEAIQLFNFINRKVPKEFAL
jgi:hypothetical protein